MQSFQEWGVLPDEMAITAVDYASPGMTGAMSENIVCSWTYAGDPSTLPIRVLVKLVVENPNNLAEAPMRRLYERELWFYPQHLPELAFTAGPMMPRWARRDVDPPDKR